VVKRSDGVYLRYYIEGQDGQRKKATEKLCGLEATRHTIENARRKRMKAINEQTRSSLQAPANELLVGEFWEKDYLPWVTEKKRFSTVYGYKKLWTQYLSKELASSPLRAYRAADGYRFLEALSDKLGRNSLRHVRSLASGIFTRAVNLGLIERNPWRDVRMQEARAPRPTVAYSLEESIKILRALSSRVDAALVFTLAAFLGMRPSEIAGLKWEDIEETQLNVRQAVVRGVAGETKTKQSQRSLPLIEPVRSLVAAWREQCGGVTVGWVFTSRGGSPLKMESFVKPAIMPAVREAGLQWHGLYAARRACATNLVKLTGNVNAAHQVLGNSFKVAMDKYIKPSIEAGLAGLKLLEAATTVESSK
jgi:integrase